MKDEDNKQMVKAKGYADSKVKELHKTTVKETAATVAGMRAKLVE
jgi:hypothetical protein